MLPTGLYEQIIYLALHAKLNNVRDLLKPSKSKIDSAEAPQILSQYLSQIITRGLKQLDKGDQSLDAQVKLANKIIELIRTETSDPEFQDEVIHKDAEQLLALQSMRDGPLAANPKHELPRPETSIAHSSLFTGARHEPQLYNELQLESQSADSIYFLVSFIKWSGLSLIMDALKDFTRRGGCLNVITTSYLGATDIKAIRELAKLPKTTIHVSYDSKRTRLHAKTYVFYRKSGFHTAYIGSSNISRAALSSGMEWNVKITEQDLPETMAKIFATIEQYQNDPEFELYDESQEKRLHSALLEERRGPDSPDENVPYFYDLRPYAFQEQILQRLSAEREVRGYYRNLIVAATGTGKTFISAFDYRRFVTSRRGQPNRLLFIAHREEILKQSLHVYRAVLKDANFGDLLTGFSQPQQIDHLFLSIQSFQTRDWTSRTSADFYDYIVVDETHHGSAQSYQDLFEYYRPTILLGLTATPERLDGRDITTYFDNRFAAEIRLPEAINRNLLCPFHYYGLADDVDLREVRWTRGGYDINELTRIYTIDAAIAWRRVQRIIDALYRHTNTIEDVIGLGFCVSIEHARFMAKAFNEAGIPSLALTASSPREERKTARQRLVAGELRILFVVDLFNEGVDIPEINTVLFLRPTESLTVFLQQLGRGLRLSEGKEHLTVLDFIGQANKRFSYEERFAALLEKTRHNVDYEIRHNFNALPAGCYIRLERKAQEYILANIRASFSNVAALIERVRQFEENSGLELTLAHFLNYYHLDPRRTFRRCSFSELCVRAGCRQSFDEPAEDAITKALPKFYSINSRKWLAFLKRYLENIDDYPVSNLNRLEQTWLRMFLVTIWDKLSPLEDLNAIEILEKIVELKQSPVMLAELRDIIDWQFEQIDFVDREIDLDFATALSLHCDYSRDQLLVALGYYKYANMREGVLWHKDIETDVFLVTLNKSDKDYSPSTLYHDYAISDRLFHWQSQSRTATESDTGQRYIHHEARGSHILLFIREHKKDEGGTLPYTFVGSAKYVTHEGSRPMSITLRLEHALPPRLMSQTSLLAVN
ncbi:MAG: DUF3427 domain-containing protein [Bacillota bacterium]|nr:DUF3427 domain-containing protein [Bacillota bacterium]